jgi:hypothetical protein
MVKPKTKQPGLSTIDAVINLYAHQHGIRPVEAARELLRELASWFGIDFAREARRAAGEEVRP